MTAEKLSRRQAAIIGCYTGVCCGPFEDIQSLGDELMGRPTWTHEYGSRGFADELKERAQPLFCAICADRDHEGRPDALVVMREVFGDD